MSRENVEVVRRLFAALDGQDWYVQWFVADPSAVGGIAASVGARFELFTR